MSEWRGNAQTWETGTGLAGFRWPAASAKAVVLLQHGLSEYSERYVDQYSGLIPTLQQHGFDVHAVDLAGHGRSPGARAYTDVESSVRAHLEARRQLEALGMPLFLFGHSLGGLVTATSVLERPQGVKGVILSSPALLVEAGALRKRLARWLAHSCPRCPVGSLDPAGLSRIAEKVRAAEADPLKSHGRLQARMAASILSVSEANWARYAAWTVPVLAVHGTADRYTAVQGSRRFIDEVASADKTLLLDEGGYHELLNDLGAPRVLASILAWLDERAGGPITDR
jgi:alpha-beta hydrolase superfamily lysophospholipase